jgi:lysophospholipase L1-like esterase
MEILATTRGVNFGSFSVESRGEPRNQGYEFNWARSDATTDDLIATGQHTGLAKQASRGEIDVVWIFIGGNDFINAMKSREPLAEVSAVLPRALANFRKAFEAIFEASSAVRVVLVTVPDIRNLPEFSRPIREGRIPSSTADAFSSAISEYNAQIRTLAGSSNRVALLDFDLSVQLANRLSHETNLAAGRRLTRIRPGNDPECFFLADSRHPGTLGQTLLAQMFIETVNARFAARIPSLSGREVLELVPPGASLATATQGQ